MKTEDAFLAILYKKSGEVIEKHPESKNPHIKIELYFFIAHIFLEIVMKIRKVNKTDAIGLLSAMADLATDFKYDNIDFMPLCENRINLYRSKTPPPMTLTNLIALAKNKNTNILANTDILTQAVLEEKPGITQLVSNATWITTLLDDIDGKTETKSEKNLNKDFGQPYPEISRAKLLLSILSILSIFALFIITIVIMYKR